jgi:hypothetical protein
MREHFNNPHIVLESLAAPATTSAWALTHFNKVLSLKVDLLLVDYGVNDPISSSSAAGRESYAGIAEASFPLLLRCKPLSRSAS